jgi:hypothetical protein
VGIKGLMVFMHSRNEDARKFAVRQIAEISVDPEVCNHSLVVFF